MKKSVIIVIMILMLFTTPAFAEDMPVIEWTTTTGFEKQTGEISESWEEIITHIDDGTAEQRYSVGATKALDLGEIGVIHMQLAGFDLDERADGSGKAATTWIAVELLPERKPMNVNYTAKGGWRDSDLRAWLQSDVLPAIPGEVRQRLVDVNKWQQYSIDWQETTDTVWIPDDYEVFGEYEEDSLYNSLFINKEENRVKRCNGSAAWWWLRSAYDDNLFRTVNSNGYANGTNANYSGGVALGFCL